MSLELLNSHSGAEGRKGGGGEGGMTVPFPAKDRLEQLKVWSCTRLREVVSAEEQSPIMHA